MLKDRSGKGEGAIRASLEKTREGLPLSANRAPADDLKPWVARVFTTNVEMAPDEGLSCGFLSDSPAMRILFAGEWQATSAAGTKRYQNEVLFFGPHSRVMPISVTGSFSTLTVALMPGSTRAFGSIPIEKTINRIVPYSAFGFDSARLFARFAGKENPEDRLLEIEQVIREYIKHKNFEEPDPITRAFDMAALADPNIPVSEFAEQHGIALKTVERIVKRDFGMAPKKVLRRARVLDMAAVLCGVADEAEADEMALRYFDQSHLSREFATFFKMTPAQFATRQQPLMTLALEVRQARRLELLGRLDPDRKRPWQA